MSLKSILTFTFRYLSALSKQGLLQIINILRKEYVDLEEKYQLLVIKNKEFEAFCTDSKISCLDFPTEAEFNVIEENNKIFLRYPPQEIMGIQPRVQIASMSLRIATDVVLAYKDDKQKPITQDGAVEIIKMIQENLFTHFLNLINNNTSTDKEL